MTYRYDRLMSKYAEDLQSEQRTQEVHSHKVDFDAQMHQLELQQKRMDMDLEAKKKELEIQHQQEIQEQERRIKEQELAVKEQELALKQQEIVIKQQEARAKQQENKSLEQQTQTPGLTQQNYTANLAPKEAAYADYKDAIDSPAATVSIGGVLGAGAGHYMFPSKPAKDIRKEISTLEKDLKGAKPSAAVVDKIRALRYKALGANWKRLAAGAVLGAGAGYVADQAFNNRR